MNGRPHLHNIVLTDRGVTYGDTNVFLMNWWGRTPSIRRTKRGIRRAVIKHDRGTLKAVERDAQVTQLKKPINDVLKPRRYVRDEVTGKKFYEDTDKESFVLRSRNYNTVTENAEAETWGSDLIS